MSRRALRLFVSGRVQGVGYRAFAAHEARARGIDGFVRNLRDGRVEVLAAGPASELEGFVAALRRGPRSGRVDDLAIEAAAAPDAPGFFIVAATA